MPLAVTHVLLTVIIVDIYRDYVTKHKKYFTLHTLFLAGVFALLPDLDFVLRIFADLFNFNLHWLLQHGGILHTPFFALLFLIPAVILWNRKKHKTAVYFYVTCFAIIFHIFLDYLLGGGGHSGIMWLFPLTTQAWKIHLLTTLNLKDIPQALDAVILLTWLWHEEKKHKISDFI